MKVSKRLAASVAAAFGLAIAGANVLAHPGGQGGMGQCGMHRMGQGMMGGGMGHGAMGACMVQGVGPADANQAGCEAGTGPKAMRGGMGHGQMGQGGMGRGCMGQASAGQGAKPGERGPMGGQSLFTPEERQAMRDKMRSAATPEERQQIAQSNRAEMQKRAQDKGITLPEGRGPRSGFGQNAAPSN